MDGIQETRDNGTAVVFANAGQEWREYALGIIESLARELPEFTSDDVRERIKRPPHHHNAFGAALPHSGLQAEWIARTDPARNQ